MKIKATISLFLMSVLMLALAACGGDNKGSSSGGNTAGGDAPAAERPAVPDEFKGKKAPEGFTADAAAGKKDYDATCKMCHGDAGAGDGPAGATKPPAADLTTGGMDDDYLYFRIVKGAGVVEGSTMTGLAKGNASDEDYEKKVWNVIEYVKSLKK
ncbi:MAG: c-type cytochrome [Planctomycetota bacterium]|jgi:cytochrome c5